jgi:5-methylcytosine-specific restriction enzyme A
MPRAIPRYRPLWLPDPAIERAAYERRPERREDIAFYQSDAWRSLRSSVLAEHPLCARCERLGQTRLATHVHHVRERKDRPDLALDRDNLEALCNPCHSKHHAKQRKWGR